ncbi:MAG: calcium/sodium antiporter, partial [Chitinispirillaceae bacterium]|nr:calcium/sodium antiporter [Chitinispirillaceae bacterium]
MEILKILIYLIAGFVLLYFGADFLVCGSARVALYYRVSPLVVGLTIVAFGTSSPELVVSIISGWKGLGDIAIGNVIGSNIFNIAVIVGLSSLIRPININLQLIKFDTPIMIFVSILFLVFLADFSINRIEAFVLFVGIIIYTAVTFYWAKKKRLEAAICAELDEIKGDENKLLKNFLMIGGGILMLVVGSDSFVKGAVGLARILHISEAVIALTVVAAGTSLPELATSVVAAIKKESDIAIGNIIGSNIFNILAIIGVAGMLTPLYSKGITYIDIAFMIGTSIVILPIMFFWNKI